MAEDLIHVGRKHGRVTACDQEAGLAVVYECAQSSDRRRHHRGAAGCCFERHQAKRLASTRHDADVGSAIPTGQQVMRNGLFETNPVFEPVGSNGMFHPRQFLVAFAPTRATNNH